MAIVFKPETHSYTSIDPTENITWTSVTGVISKFKKPFDADAIAAKSVKFIIHKLNWLLDFSGSLNIVRGLSMNNIPKVVIRFIGILSIIMACLGLWYNTLSFFSVLGSFEYDPEMPYLKPVFFVMSFVCVACYVWLLVIGIDFVRLKLRFRHIFAGLLIFEVAYFISISILWISPVRNFSMSVAAATGIANGGLMFQFITLFPLWAPILVVWAHKRIRAQQEVI